MNIELQASNNSHYGVKWHRTNSNECKQLLWCEFCIFYLWLSVSLLSVSLFLVVFVSAGVSIFCFFLFNLFVKMTREIILHAILTSTCRFSENYKTVL